MSDEPAPISWARFGRGGLSVGTHCYYCGRAMPAVLEQGCGSQEFPTQERVNELCEVYQRARARPRATPSVS